VPETSTSVINTRLSSLDCIVERRTSCTMPYVLVVTDGWSVNSRWQWNADVGKWTEEDSAKCVLSWSKGIEESNEKEVEEE